MATAGTTSNIPQIAAVLTILVGVVTHILFAPDISSHDRHLNEFPFFLVAVAICVVHYARLPKGSVERRITSQIAVVALLAKLAFEFGT
jgi:hypothetical protein